MALIRKGWAKPSDKIYSTGLVVAGRKVGAFVKDVPRESPAGKPGASPSNPPKEGPDLPPSLVQPVFAIHNIEFLT